MTLSQSCFVKRLYKFGSYSQAGGFVIHAFELIILIAQYLNANNF